MGRSDTNLARKVLDAIEPLLKGHPDALRIGIYEKIFDAFWDEDYDCLEELYIDEFDQPIQRALLNIGYIEPDPYY